MIREWQLIFPLMWEKLVINIRYCQNRARNIPSSPNRPWILLQTYSNFTLNDALCLLGLRFTTHPPKTPKPSYHTLTRARSASQSYLSSLERNESFPWPPGPFSLCSPLFAVETSQAYQDSITIENGKCSNDLRLAKVQTIESSSFHSKRAS